MRPLVDPRRPYILPVLPIVRAGSAYSQLVRNSQKNFLPPVVNSKG